MRVHCKLFALGAAAVVGIAVPSALLIGNMASQASSLRRFRDTTAISLQAYQLADNVTRERQLAYQAAGFSGEGSPAEQLARFAQAIEASQTAMRELRNLSERSRAGHSPRFRESLESALRSEPVVAPFRKELLSPDRTTDPDQIRSLRSTVLKAYDVVLLTQANFLPVLCLETGDAELVRRISTQDNVARLQRDFWKVKGLVNTVLRDNHLGETAYGELKTKRLAMDDHLSRLHSMADAETAKAINTLLTDSDYSRIITMADTALKLGIKAPDFSSLGINQTDYQSGPFTRVESAFSRLSEAVANSITSYTDEHLATTRQQLWIMLAGGLGGLAVLVGAVTVIARSISRPLRALSQELMAATNHGTQSSQVIADSSKSLSDDACEEASALEEISASVEELNSMTLSTLAHIRNLSQLARDADAATSGGAQQMGELVAAMDGVRQTNHEIAKILKSIDEIAFQTNILALNAAVEAARAGEAGAGFAVVAEEVRNLAGRSAEAARETRNRIESAIGTNTRSAELSQAVNAQFSTVTTVTKNYHELVQQIEQASSQSTQGLSQVRDAITRLDSITQRTAATAEENAAASHEFRQLVDQLRESAGALESMVASCNAFTTASRTR